MIRAAAIAALACTWVGATPICAEPHEPLALFWSNPAPPKPLTPSTTPARVRPRATTAVAPSPGATLSARASAPATRSGPVLAVFGDEFAASIARGLTERTAAGPGWTVSDQTSDTVALTAPEADDPVHVVDAWEKRGGHVDAAVVMLGRHDDAPLHDAAGARADVGTPMWRSLYGERVEKVAAAFRDQHIPLIWVGLPIVRDAGEAQRYAAMNEVIREGATKGGAIFVDTWQAFADDNGDFTPTGPDVNGQSATLRWTNGWNFTRAGALKLASFLIPDLKRTRDRLRAAEALAVVPNANSDDFDQALSIDVNAQIRREAGLPPVSGAGEAKALAGPVLALTAAPLSDHGQLLPIPTTRPNAAASETLRVSHPGRADDFTWPRP